MTFCNILPILYKHNVKFFYKMRKELNASKTRKAKVHNKRRRAKKNNYIK